jgi:tetratricopeptide (TPR) repeat protein
MYMRTLRRSSLALAVTMTLGSSLHAQSLRKPARKPVRRPVASSRIADSARVMIESAALAGSLPRLAAARTLLDKSLRARPNDALLLHYRGYAQYRMANLRNGVTGTAELIADLAAARESLERSIAARPMPESYLLLASVEQRLAGLDPVHVAALDAAAQRHIEMGTTIGESNPRVFLLAGISALYTPTQLGGGDHAAEQLLNHAITLYRTDHPAPPAPGWGEGEAYAWLGQVYQRTNRKDKALAAYRHALKLEPRFAWVKDVLIPGLGK